MSELTEELKLKFQSYDQEKLDDAFIDACQKSDLDVIKYLLTSPELKEHADIHAKDDMGFRHACSNGHLPVVKYLLTSAELTLHANIHAINDQGFRLACVCGHLEIIRYLLTSPELKEHADIHVYEDDGFRWSCKNRHWKVSEYLLTFSAENYINFQNMEYHLDWALSQKRNKIVKAMIKSLYKNDRFNYLENISKIEKYCLEHGFNFDKWKKEIMKEDININSHTTELFV